MLMLSLLAIARIAQERGALQLAQSTAQVAGRSRME
jgi:hypothetical protein